MELIELKSHAYDCISNIQTWQKELQATNDLINKNTSAKVTPAITVEGKPVIEGEIVEPVNN